MTVLAWPHQRQPLEIMKEYTEITGMNSGRMEQKHKASYMKMEQWGNATSQRMRGGLYVKDEAKGKMRNDRNKTT
jgi:hypothetical protein